MYSVRAKQDQQYTYYYSISSKLYFYDQYIFRYIISLQQIKKFYMFSELFISGSIYHVFYNTFVLRRRVCLFCAVRLSARSRALYPKNVNSLNSICHRIDEAYSLYRADRRHVIRANCLCKTDCSFFRL